ncbi:Predicted naringenin-chalcone synthase [Prosthecobacter debontii]|uniref:Predicted naringenin-chalcone synthase n=1 Tax=Prosthecobacter debontii TaxID=48467 RepID=A0A1T4Y5V0_9BACT|nr:type III polyketide synthase [Prosthecobacter debontii]SKA97149.1 Predicted naringenin-chalcone synthase [Prosthecobacter debontii]
MSAFIHHIATITPAYTYSQSYTRDRLKEWTQNTKTKRLIQAIYNRSGIETRHSVTGDFVAGTEASLYRSDVDGKLIPPGTAERNRVYAHAAKELSVEVTRRALSHAVGFEAKDITHIIYTSCTGFANPGPDYHVIRELGLRENVQRYTLGFMGCYAAFPALRMAAQFCEADSEAVVLVICLELCTLHMQINDEPDSILANSLFADGAAAAIVSARSPSGKKPAYQMNGFESALVPSSESEMAWEIGNEGFNIVLSSYVPDIIGGNIKQLLRGILTRRGSSLEAIDEWAVHPGGRSILDKVEESLHLDPDALEASRTILRDYGNMSSATILFVLKEMMDSADTEHAQVCAMAFGPGLTVETALLERVGCSAPASRSAVEHTHS